MRRKFAVLSLPVAALALAGVLSAVPTGSAAVESAPATAPRGSGEVAQAAGTIAPVAVTMTSWEETARSQVTPPTTKSGTPPTR